MRGVVFLGERKLEIQEFPDPTPGPGEVVIAIKASGMCGSDLHPYRAVGNAAAALGLGSGGPVIAGHEPCGVVAAVGTGVAPDFAPVGARVMNHHYKGCGRCKHCRVGWSQLCRNGITVYGMTGHGGHAPFMKAPAFTMVPLPDEISFEEGGVIAVDVSPERLALAKEFGADAVVNSKETDPVAAIHELTHGEGAETTMDCTGVAEARVAAVRSAGTWGRVALVGEGGTTTFDISQHLLRRQLTIHASWTFSAMGQAECARFIVDRKVPLRKLLTHRFKLDEADRAYKLFDTQTTGKGVFVF